MCEINRICGESTIDESYGGKIRVASDSFLSLVVSKVMTRGHHTKNEPPVLIVGFARLSNILEIADTILRDAPCCLIIQIDGGKFHRDSQEFRRFQAELEKKRPITTEVTVRLESSNLGIAQNLTNGVNHAFTDHSSVVVLEDDCYPSPIFYRFMKGALEEHNQNQKIGMVTGNAYIHYPPGPLFTEVSSTPLTWGWATWRDRWVGFDPKLSKFTPDEMDKAIARSSKNPLIRSHWRRRIRASLEDRNMWDAQWAVYMWIRSYSCLNPSTNLVSNKGVDDNATHTQSRSIFTDWPSSTLGSLTIESKNSLASPFQWSRIRKIRHFALLRLDLLRALLESLRVPGRQVAVSTLQAIIATARRPKS